MTNAITICDFEKICRTCLKFTESLTSITLLNIVEMIKTCSSVQIWSNDDLPNHLCDLCVTQLQNAFNFKYLCEKSDTELRKIIENTELKSLEIIEDKVKVETLNYEFKPDFDYSDEIKDENEISDSDDQKDQEIDDNIENSENIKNTIKEKNPLKKSKKIYNCETCKHKFSKTWKLGIHMKKTHNANGTKCSRCSFICYHKLHLESHERSHFEKKYFCEVCKKGYINKRKLKHHQISHSNDRPFHCTQCDLSFKARFILTKHIKTVHVSQICEVCQICGKNVRKSYLERHLKIHEERAPFPCTECNKKFSLEKSLEIHFKRVHQNEALKYRYLCNICGRGVVSRAELKRHLNAHTGVKPFECDICHKSYGRTGALNHHKKTVHLNQRPCVCPICAQAFHSKNILQNHMRKHTGERPYACLVCGKSFGFRCVLKTHMKVHAT